MPKPLENFQNLSRSPSANHLRTAMAAAGNVPRPDRHPLTIFETRQLWNWIKSYIQHLGPRHDFLPASAAANGTSVYTVPNNLRVSIAGDWGTGTDEAYFVAKQMMKWDDGTGPDVTIHLGDTYFVGDPREVEENVLGGGKDVDPATPPTDFVKWPAGSLGMLAMNGNHEMYTGGQAYFDIMLPHMGLPPGDPDNQKKGQGCSFFCLENDYWRVIGLDTGYNSVGWPVIELIPWVAPKCPLCDDLLDWLRNTVRPKSKPKGTIVLSHHQAFSAFPKEPNYPKPVSQLVEFFAGEEVLWLWGHEHRFSGYHSVPGNFDIHGRCIGHGGMPTELCPPRPKGNARDPYPDKLLFYDNRPNPLYPTNGKKNPAIGFNGYAEVAFADETITIRYKSLVRNMTGSPDKYDSSNLLLLTETFKWDGQGHVRLTNFNPVPIRGFVIL
jgi:hypothetical protein